MKKLFHFMHLEIWTKVPTERAELRVLRTACARVETSRARVATNPQKLAYHETNEVLRGRTDTR